MVTWVLNSVDCADSLFYSWFDCWCLPGACLVGVLVELVVMDAGFVCLWVWLSVRSDVVVCCLLC